MPGLVGTSIPKSSCRVHLLYAGCLTPDDSSALPSLRNSNGIPGHSMFDHTWRYSHFKTEKIMSKSQEVKKSTKKEPAKTPKEKKADKKIKKAEKLRQQ